MNSLNHTLAAYLKFWPLNKVPYEGLDPALEQKHAAEIKAFLQKHGEQGLQRSCGEGHLTASALVVNLSFDKVLLMLHAKLQKWLQLGGHVDGERDAASSALREAREESGQDEIELFRWDHFYPHESLGSPLPFDCDVHSIPARKNEAAHFHFDLRYLCRVDDRKPLVRNEESHDLRWLSLSEARALTDEPSMLRQFAKLEAMRPTFLTGQSAR